MRAPLKHSTGVLLPSDHVWGQDIAHVMAPPTLCETQLCHDSCTHASCCPDLRETRQVVRLVGAFPTFSLPTTNLEDLSSLPQPLQGDTRTPRHTHTQTHTQNNRSHSRSDEACTSLIFPLLLIHKGPKNVPLSHFWQVLTPPLKWCHLSSNNLCEKRVSVLSSCPFFLLPSFSPLYLTFMGTCFYLSVLFACIFFFWALGISSWKIQSI